MKKALIASMMLMVSMAQAAKETDLHLPMVACANQNVRIELYAHANLKEAQLVISNVLAGQPTQRIYKGTVRPVLAGDQQQLFMNGQTSLQIGVNPDKDTLTGVLNLKKDSFVGGQVMFCELKSQPFRPDFNL